MTAVAEAPILLGHWPVGSSDWHAARAGGLGGSEIAAVLGLSPFESPFSLWHRKAGRIGQLVESPEMEWGKRLEAAVVLKFAEEHPELDVSTTGTWRHGERAWQVANPDALLFDVGEMGAPTALLEVKCAAYAYEWGAPGSDEIPVHYLTQCRWYLDVLGLDVCHVAVLIGGHDYREYVVRQNAEDVVTMREAAAEFLRSVARGDRPDIDSHAATYQAVRELHPDIEPTDVDLPFQVARRYCLARHALKLAEVEETHTKSLVADLLGNARRARYAAQTIAQRQSKGGGTPFLVAGRALPKFEEEATE